MTSPDDNYDYPSLIMTSPDDNYNYPFHHLMTTNTMTIPLLTTYDNPVSSRIPFQHLTTYDNLSPSHHLFPFPVSCDGVFPCRCNKETSSPENKSA